MKLKNLRIGNLIARLPIIQGGMAVKVSTAPLAAAVANEGCIGLIAGSGMGPLELKEEIRKARELSDGILGVNIMVAISEFKELVKIAVQEGIDLIVAGAGFSRDLFTIGRENNIEIVPIVSSVKLAKISEKLGASAIVVEGKEAGGHLGTDQPLKTLLEDIVEAVKIPVIGAGGIVEGQDIAEVINLGAAGVQMGSRFVLSEECEVDYEFKKLYLEAKADSTVLIDSPVGLPGRALKNAFIENLNSEQVFTGKKCNYLCLKKCSRRFCIFKALREARLGNMEDGLVFAGEKVHLLNDILPVKQIIKNLVDQVSDL